jgi:outer membrane murein-binding lipoprotein Lpp
MTHPEDESRAFPPAPPTFTPAAVAVPPPPATDPAPVYSAPPYTGYPYSAPPAPGPYGYGPPPPAPRRGRASTVVLSVFMVLFLVVAGVMSTLFVLKTREAGRLTTQVGQLSEQASDQRGEIDTLRQDLEGTRRDLETARDEAAEVGEQKTIVAACVNAITEFFAAIADSQGASTPAVEDSEEKMGEACDEAEKYL